jgi:hypothetical protein
LTFIPFRDRVGNVHGGPTDIRVHQRVSAGEMSRTLSTKGFPAPVSHDPWHVCKQISCQHRRSVALIAGSAIGLAALGVIVPRAHRNLLARNPN